MTLLVIVYLYHRISRTKLFARTYIYQLLDNLCDRFAIALFEYRWPGQNAFTIRSISITRPSK